MKRVCVSFTLVMSMFLVGQQADATPEFSSIEPIAWTFSVAEPSCQPAGCTPRPGYVHVEKYHGNMPVGTTNYFPNQLVEICDSGTCQVVSIGLDARTDSNVGAYLLYADVPVPSSLDGRVLTFAFPKDLNNPSAGFGPKSNAVDSSRDRHYGIGDITDKPLMQITYMNLSSTEINNVGVCFNNDGSTPFVPRNHGITTDRIDLSGYEEGHYSLTSGTKVLETGSLTGGSNSAFFLNRGGGLCAGDGGSGTVFPYKRISGLSAGTVYSLNYTLTGPGKRDISSDLKFLTPGGCPSSDVGELSGPDPWLLAAIDSEGKFLYPFTTVTPISWVKSLIGTRVAPMYVTATKSFPLRNRTAPDWPNMWRYIPEFDDWAQSVNGEYVITTQMIISSTLYAQCAPSSLKVTVTVLSEEQVHAKQFCIVENGQVIPTGEGPCLLKVVVSRAIASKSGVQKMGTPTILKVPLFIKSFDGKSAGTAGRVRACNFAVTKKYSPSIAKKVIPCSKLKAKSGQTLSVTVTAQSKAICQVKSGLLKRKNQGSCVLHVSVKKGKKVLSTQKVLVPVN